MSLPKRSYHDMNSPSVGIPVNQQQNLQNQTMTTRNQSAQAFQQSNNASANGNSNAAQQRRLMQQRQHRQMAQTLGNQHGLPYNPVPKAYKFAETEEEILEKFEDQEPSLDFHIHDNHYRFGNQDGVIPKSNSMVKDFLECIVSREIPGAIVEVLRDAGVRFYEGCLIVKVIDHRGDTERSYKTLLKPTQLSMFYDLLYQTDSALQRFSDTLGISMEAELLSITKRKLELRVPTVKDKSVWLKDTGYPRLSEDGTRVIHDHRVECQDPNSKAFKPFKELHEDSPQQTSEYEQFMTVLNDAKKMNGMDLNSSETLQFSRLRFIEQFKARKEKLKQNAMNQQNRSDVTSPLVPPGIGIGNANSQSGQNLQSLNPQQQTQFQLQQQRLKMQQQGASPSGVYPNSRFPGPGAGSAGGSSPSGMSMSTSTMNGNLTALQQEQLNLQQQKAMAQQKLASGNLVDEDGKKLKKPKKLTKKQQEKLAKEQAANGGGFPQVAGKTIPGQPFEEPKKKRGTYKKKKKDE